MIRPKVLSEFLYYYYLYYIYLSRALNGLVVNCKKHFFCCNLKGRAVVVFSSRKCHDLRPSTDERCSTMGPRHVYELCPDPAWRFQGELNFVKTAYFGGFGGGEGGFGWLGAHFCGRVLLTLCRHATTSMIGRRFGKEALIGCFLLGNERNWMLRNMELRIITILNYPDDPLSNDTVTQGVF